VAGASAAIVSAIVKSAFPTVAGGGVKLTWIIHGGHRGAKRILYVRRWPAHGDGSTIYRSFRDGSRHASECAALYSRWTNGHQYGKILHELTRQLPFPRHFGRNLDALWDVLTVRPAGARGTDVGEGGPLRKAMGGDYELLVELLREAAEERGDLEGFYPNALWSGFGKKGKFPGGNFPFPYLMQHGEHVSFSVKTCSS